MNPLLQNKNISNCCRTCLNEVFSESYELFCEYQKNTTLAEILLSCTSILVDKEDSFPKILCSRCFNYLVSFYHFKTHAEKVNNVLKISKLGELKEESLVPLKEPFQIKPEIENVAQDHDFNDNLENDYHEPEESTKEEMVEINNEQNYIFKVKKENLDKTINSKAFYKCKICDKKFRTLSKQQRHESKHCEKYTCNFCFKTFMKRNQLVKHLVLHSKTKEACIEQKTEDSQSLKCTICLVSFKSVQSLSAHMRKHVEKGRVLSCTLCDKVFKKMSHLKRHELSHEVNRPFKCNTCPKSFITESLLNDHKNRHHGIKPHVCPLCSKRFFNVSGLSTHIKSHTANRKVYLCSICGKKFDCSTNLNQHMKRHMGLKTFACNLCPRSFVSKGELKSHTTTHTGEKKYTCEECGAAFTKQASLGKHKLRHSGIKPHQCDTCSRKFSCLGHLKRHFRVHTGEKPYRCEICDKAFAQSYDLVKHKRAHLGEKLYSCSHCTESFRLKSELRQHIPEHYLSARQRGTNMVISSQDCSDSVNGKETQKLVESTDIMNKDAVINNIEMKETAPTLPEYKQ